jgi:hypothetical protein
MAPLRSLFTCESQRLPNELDPAEADRLLNDICSASGERAQLQAMEDFLNRKLARTVAIHPAVVYAVEQLSHAGFAASWRVFKRACP